MAESTPNEHESNESDEDCEIYFLKPVNEYNIVDKIKEANKVLFEGNTNVNAKIVNSRGIEAAADLVADADIEPPQRKVTFAPNLETYEPDNSIAEALKLSREFEEAVAEAKELDRKLTNICAYEKIIEETGATVKTADAGTIDQSVVQTLISTDLTDTERDSMHTPIAESACTIELNEPSKVTELVVEEDIVEEICEEIVVMDMENEEPKAATTKSPKMANARRIYKFPTFDCAEEDPPELSVAVAEQDNKSMVNLLTSDGEEECCSTATFDINADNSDLDVDDIDADTYTNEYNVKSVNGDVDDELNSINTSNDGTNTDAYGDDEDDDDLSIIVASYLPDDFEKKRLDGNSRLKSKNKSKSLLSPFSKRFSFRSKRMARNDIVTAFGDNAGMHADTKRVRQPHIIPPEVTDLNLNYRICCEYRRQLSQPEKLPKYTGYLSEYGLSRQQLELREENLQRKQRYALQQALKVNDVEMHKMQDNERAFTTWLRNKMRFPINKTRNMFDVKSRNLDAHLPSGGVCGSNNAVRNASGKRK